MAVNGISTSCSQAVEASLILASPSAYGMGIMGDQVQMLAEAKRCFPQSP